MHWIIPAALLLALSGAAQAREPLARPMERTPSIMVGGETSRPAKTVKRRKAEQPQASRTRRSRISRSRAIAVPRASTIYEAETGSINRSISQQQQLLQSQQRQQIENNLFRQEIQRSTTSPIGTPSLGCTPGSLGC